MGYSKIIDHESDLPSYRIQLFSLQSYPRNGRMDGPASSSRSSSRYHRLPLHLLRIRHWWIQVSHESDPFNLPYPSATVSLRYRIPLQCPEGYRFPCPSLSAHRHLRHAHSRDDSMQIGEYRITQVSSTDFITMCNNGYPQEELSSYRYVVVFRLIDLFLAFFGKLFSIWSNLIEGNREKHWGLPWKRIISSIIFPIVGIQHGVFDFFARAGAFGCGMGNLAPLETAFC